jgi:hypothetical protein
MKTLFNSSLSKRKRETGAALVVTLIFAVGAVAVLGTYLLLVTNDAKNIARSQDWNRALAYAEAGVDEALAQINASPSDFSANSWGSSGGSYGPVTRSMANGSYSVSIVGGAAPTIYATGFVDVASSDAQVMRVVKVSAKQLGLFPVAFAAINRITLNGNGVTSDSYNSHDPNLSNNGLYDPSKTSTNGNVASVQGIVDPGNHTIVGSLYLGPNATYDGSDGNVTGEIYYDYNVQFPDVTIPTPSTGWTIAVPVTTTNTVVTVKNNGKTSTSTTISSAYHFTTSGSYQITGNYPIVVDPGVNVTLNVTTTSIDLTSLQIHDGGNIDNSGTAQIYLNGPSSVALAGNQAVDASGRPENLWVYGTDNLTSITFSGNAQFTGVIYAPHADVSLNGGGNNSLDVAGSVIVNSITDNGHFALHYDEYLSSLGSRGFIPTAWQELSWSEN